MKHAINVLFTLICVSYSCAQNPNYQVSSHTIASEHLNESRDIWIGLPVHYDSTKTYPTLYVMDAEWQFDIAYSIMKELAANDKIPSHIVVGIPHVDHLKRTYDLTFGPSTHNSSGEKDEVVTFYFGEGKTGGGPTFLKYLSEEVVPFVNAKHKSNGFDVFVGHSLSGYYGAYLVTMDTPFNAFQIYDPSIWYNQMKAIDHLQKTLPNDFRSNIYIATANGGRDRQQYNVDAHKNYYNVLKENKVNAILKSYDENHGAVRLPALIDGLTNLYEGYSIGYIFPTDTLIASDATAHYAAFSEKVNYTFEAPADAYRWIGFANHHQGKWEQAIEAYEFCGIFYNSDVNMMLEYADCYYQLEQFQESEVLYTKVLEIDAENETAKKRLQDLD